ncbi:PilZ domain-containing protein [Clostridium sp. E02]|uniref:PilZ domain-containing protein n=1 Tax=Clostridium sp. E02 TaxID=2487134 RepID=UPI000F533AA5|nr:PilZ domain-containing protein [Clostridium sp. E02]
MFKECEKACIYSLDNVFLAEVRVLDGEQEEMGLIFDQEEDMDKVNTESIVVFYDAIQGLVTCKCSLSGRLKVTGDEVGELGRAIYKVPCRIVEHICVEQRRKDLKVRVSLLVELEGVDHEGNSIHVPAKIKDISAGGIGFESEAELTQGDVYSFLFKTSTGSSMLKVSILWGESYRYGGRFFDQTSFQESLVRKFTFQEQLKNRKVQ